MRALIEDLERSGPEAVGAPLRAVAVLAQDVGDLFPDPEDTLTLRRRRATAARLARRALSLGTAVHGVVADRPELARAWAWNARELGERVALLNGRPARDAECLRALGRIAALTLSLPALPDEDWETQAIAFADEGALADLHDACLDLAAAAVRLVTAV